MENKITENLPKVGEMNKRVEKMADEKRYIIYYTFETNENLNQAYNHVRSEKNV